MVRKRRGGCDVCFKGRKETMEQVFGRKKINSMYMNKVFWKYIKAKKLQTKKQVTK